MYFEDGCCQIDFNNSPVEVFCTREGGDISMNIWQLWHSMKSSELSPELSPHNSFTASIIVHYTGMVLGKADETKSFFVTAKMSHFLTNQSCIFGSKSGYAVEFFCWSDLAEVAA